MIETGDILLEKGKGLIPEVIKAYTNSEYSHAALVIDYFESLNKCTIVESSLFKGVEQTYLTNLEGYDVYRLKGNLDVLEKIRLKKIARGYIGMQYDLSQIFGYLFMGLFKGNILNTPNEIICSELEDRIYSRLGYDLMEGVYKGDMTPENLANSPLLRKIN